jgi:hypothetical protein
MCDAEALRFADRCLHRAIEEAVLKDLDASHPDWQQGEGSFGTYKLDVENGGVSVELVGRPIDEGGR